MPNPNLDRLKAVSEAADKLQHQVQVCHNRHSQIGLGKYTLKYWPAIAADLLWLKEENEALFKAAYDIYLRYPGFGQGLNEEDEYLSDNLTNVVEKYNRDHRVKPPASAEKEKCDESI